LELLVQGKPRRYAPLHRIAVLSNLQAESEGFIGRTREPITAEFCFLYQIRWHRNYSSLSSLSLYRLRQEGFNRNLPHTLDRERF